MPTQKTVASDFSIKAELIRELERCVIALEYAAGDPDRLIANRRVSMDRAIAARKLIARAKGTP